MALGAVIDASPLIYFARLGRLALIAQVVGEVGVCPAVYHEAVVAGRQRGHPDATRIAQALQGGDLRVVTLDAPEQQLANQLLGDPRLGPGECETIACAQHRGIVAILRDRKARQVAAGQGVRTLKSTDLLFLGLLRGRLTLADFKQDLRRLAQITGIDAATLIETELLADEIAALVAQVKGAKQDG